MNAPISAAPVPAAPANPTRLMSLDALRGFDMFWILGADGVVGALARVWPVAPVRFVAGQIDHSDWAGFTFYDLIFPLFVFITGVSMVFSISKTIEQHGRGPAAARIVRRAGILFLLGILYNGGLAGAWPDVRMLGVLQRIALAYAGAGLLFCFVKPRVRCATGVALLAVYWALLTFVPIKDIALERRAMAERFGGKEPAAAQVRELYDHTTTMLRGGYDAGRNLANHLDYEWLPGRRYDLYWDPEGLVSTLPAIATCLLGVMAGCWLRRSDRSAKQKLTHLFVAGVICLFIGFAWGTQFPVIKKIWTSSFVLVAGGWSLLLLGTFYYVVDVRQWRGWCPPFVWIGQNPITLYLATALIGFGGIAQRLVGGSVAAFCNAHLAAESGGLLLAVVELGLLVFLARFLYRRQIFLRV
jgi:predicted acyltransferase